MCQGLEALSIKNSADLPDLGLIAIARGCSRLAKFEVQGCRKIMMRGMRTLARLLHRTLVEVKISCLLQEPRCSVIIEGVGAGSGSD